jgi:carboxypeptidase Q
MRYQDDVPQIPAAAVTIEDAMMMQRMQDRGQAVRVRLKMEAETLPDAISHNVVAEIVGSEYPDEVVVFGGHIDSWDVGTGAMDDAGGCVVSWDVLRMMNQLGLRPKRTMRVVLWTNEENGIRGGAAYRDRYLDTLDDHVLAIESDGGVFQPLAFGFTGSHEAFAQLKTMEPLFTGMGGMEIRRGGGGADIAPIMREGVPGMGLLVDGRKYFEYHHTHADTIDKLDPLEVNQSKAVMAIMAYVIADRDVRLPR